MVPAAYGLRFDGVDGDGLLAVRGAGDYPVVRVIRELAEPNPSTEWNLGGERASFPVGDGRIYLVRRDATATVRAPAPVQDDELVHPWLSRAGLMFGRWLGREVLHGGAFVAGGTAWALLGESGAGKSTLLAALAKRGHTVLCDDVLVLDGGAVLAGPRCIDLMPGTAAALGLRGTSRARGLRERLRLEPAPAAVTLGGLVHLAWGDGTGVERVAVTRRIPELRGHNPIRPLLPTDKVALLGLAALPTLELVRPRDLGRLDEAAAALLAAIAS